MSNIHRTFKAFASAAASVVLLLGPQLVASSPSNPLPDALVKQCLNNGRCEGAAHYVRAAIAGAEAQCAATNSLASKKVLLNELLYWEDR